MLSKSFTASIFLLALTSSVTADCVISPALGAPNPVASDVQHPSDGAPCGNIPIAQNLDTSTTIQADSSGNFFPTIQNFETGVNGSRSIKTAKVDASGTGSSFTACQIVTNGDEDPTNKGKQTLSVKLPDGIKCIGGTNKNRCLVSFITDQGDGNCAVVTQAATTEKSSTSTSRAPEQTNAQDGDKNGDKNGGDQNGGDQNGGSQHGGGQTTNDPKTEGNKKRMIRKRRV